MLVGGLHGKTHEETYEELEDEVFLLLLHLIEAILATAVGNLGCITVSNSTTHGMTPMAIASDLLALAYLLSDQGGYLSGASPRG